MGSANVCESHNFGINFEWGQAKHPNLSTKKKKRRKDRRGRSGGERGRKRKRSREGKWRRKGKKEEEKEEGEDKEEEVEEDGEERGGEGEHNYESTMRVCTSVEFFETRHPYHATEGHSTYQQQPSFSSVASRPQANVATAKLPSRYGVT
jgi:hypothetical protein